MCPLWYFVSKWLIQGTTQMTSTISIKSHWGRWVKGKSRVFNSIRCRRGKISVKERQIYICSIFSHQLEPFSWINIYGPKCLKGVLRLIIHFLMKCSNCNLCTNPCLLYTSFIWDSLKFSVRSSCSRFYTKSNYFFGRSSMSANQEFYNLTRLSFQTRV